MRTLIAFCGLRGNFELPCSLLPPASAALSWFFFLTCASVLNFFFSPNFWKPVNGMVFVAFSRLLGPRKYLPLDYCFLRSETLRTGSPRQARTDFGRLSGIHSRRQWIRVIVPLSVFQPSRSRGQAVEQGRRSCAEGRRVSSNSGEWKSQVQLGLWAQKQRANY